MAKNRWIATLDISEDFIAAEKDQISAQVLCERIAPKLERVGQTHDLDTDEFVDLFEKMSNNESATCEDFDELMSLFTDWADQHRVWIQLD